MRSFFRNVCHRARAFFAIEGYYFDRPLLMFQSDDWGRAGIPDQEALQRLRSEGLALGEYVYDLYGLESAEDLSALQAVLARHKDATGRSPCICMNFVVHNLNFAPMEADEFRRIHLLPLSDGLPRGWDRPGLVQAYREGISEGVFRPALHGSTHFCRRAVEAVLATSTERAKLLRTLWRMGTPYIYWRMPWIGYEYWNPNLAHGTFLSREGQDELIGVSVGAFAKLFSTLPRSACAPGYRADANTHSVWARYGVRVAQNGPGTSHPPHVGENELLHTYRNIEFEPAVDAGFSVESCVAQAESCFERGLPAIVSVHAINLHSSLKDFRSGTLQALDAFLAAVRTKRPNLLYLDDGNLYDLVQQGAYETAHGKTRVNVTKKKFSRVQAATSGTD
jgi:hypothetical protein